MLMLAVLVVVPLLFLIFQMIKKTIFPGSEKLPPGPDTWQILRKSSEFRTKPHTAFSDLAKIYGPLMSLQLGSRVVIVASSASIAREILQTQDKNFSGRFMPWACCKIPGIQASITISQECNDTWKLFRGISQSSIFSFKFIEAKARMRKANAVEMVRYVQSKQGQVVHLDRLIGSTLYNIASGMLVSRTHMFHDDEKRSAAVQAVTDIISSSLGMSDLFPCLRKIDFSSRRKASRIYARQRYIWEDLVKERRSARRSSSNCLSGDGDFLDVLLDNSLTDDQLYVVLTEMLIGATDSSHVVLIWLMAELIKNPRILRRVQDEVAEAFDDDMMVKSESILTESQYLQACIKETLRVHNPGPLLLPHRAIEACKIDNYVIPEDSIVLVNASAIRLETGRWDDADVFNPDRFVDSKIDFRGSTHDFEFIPFGAGRRMCPGFNMGGKNIQIVVASLVHCFEWSLPDGMDLDTIDMAEKFEGLLKKEKPLRLIPKSRRLI